jgi:thioredoxin reductase (NADPH)
MQLHDTLIVGGGPAGLSAAIHLAWHNRDVHVIDRHSGPLFFTLEKLHNVPGLPAVRGTDLQKTLLAQAKELGATHERANVARAGGAAGAFVLHGDKDQQWRAKTMLLATGVARYHPTVDGDFRPCFKFAGKGNMYYCPDCEAPEIVDKDTVVIAAGSATGGAGMAVGLSRYTDTLRLLATDESEIAEHRAKQLSEKNITVTRGEIKRLVGKRGHLDAIELQDGTVVEAEAFFVSSPARGRTDLAEQLGVEMAATGNHAQPASQRGDTNVPGVWIAGDLRPQTQQIAVAMGTGNIAALMIDQYLRKQDIRA